MPLIPIGLALFGGGVLALMIGLNSQLYYYVSPLTASWIAHGTGAIAALIVMSLFHWRRKSAPPTKQNLPAWAYLGGLSGAALVVLAVITVNSFLGITGTLVLSIVGQLVFGMVSDQFGWFGLERHPVTPDRIKAIAPILAGSILIVFAKGALV